MKTLSGNKPDQPNKGPDMGNMPIFNAKYNCSICPLKEEGCTLKVNTLNCLIAIKRFSREKHEEEQKELEKVDTQMEEDEQKALSDLMKLALEEAPNEEEEEE